MLAIYKREMRSYFTGTIGYVFLVLFLAVAGLAFCYTTLFSMSAEVGSFYIIMMIFSAIALPLLTMKSFSEERKSKIEQLLLTAPVSLGSMVLGKFLAAYTMFAGATIFSSLYFLILYRYAFMRSMFCSSKPTISRESESARSQTLVFSNSRMSLMLSFIFMVEP